MRSKIYLNIFVTAYLFFATASQLSAQPQYWNRLPTAGANVFPFGINAATGKKVQWAVRFGEFNQPAPAPASNITSIWFRPNTANTTTFTNLTIKFATVSTSTYIPGIGQWYTGPMTTVRSQNTTMTASAALQWVEIPLTTPFPYDPTMNLIIEVSQCGYTGPGFAINHDVIDVAPNYRRAYSDAASVCGATVLPTSGQFNIPAIGLTMGVSVPCPTPGAQPTGLNLTPVSVSQINGSFTAASGPPTNYLVVRYPAGATPTNPVNGTNYLVGASLGSGTVISVSSSTSFTATGLIPATTYDFYVYSYNTGLCSTTYLASSPLFGSGTTLPCSGPPVIVCPSNIIVSNTTGQCGANVTYPPATAIGDPTPVITYSQASGSFFPVGTTTVTATATSLCGTSSCTFTVRVNDTQGPTFSAPGLFPERLYYKFDGTGTTEPNLATAPPPGTATATIVGLTLGSTGKCGTALVGTGASNQSVNTNWATNMSGSWTIGFWVGPNLIDQPVNPTYLFGDVTATGGTTGAFRCFYGGAALPNNILLRGGNADVLISGVNPAATFITIVHNGVNTVVYKNGVAPVTYPVTFTSAGTGPFRVGGYSNIASINGRMDEFGMYTRALTATEVLNLFNNCPANVNNCPSNMTVGNTPGICGAVVNYTTPTALDNCPGVVTTQIQGLPSGGTFPIGTTTNSFRATDASGNTTTCTFNVTVNDTQSPVISCPSNITVSTPIGSCSAVVTYSVPATDNCAGVTVVSVPASGSTFALGITTVNSTATDAYGNTSTCSFTVTVNDGQLPVISVQPANRTACVGTNAVFSVTSSNALSYQWQQFSGGTWSNIAGATGSSYTVNSVTTAMNTNTFRVIINGLCTQVTSGMATLFVNTNPIITLSSSLPPFILPGQSVDITASGIPPGGSFVWLFNGVVIPGVTSNVLTNLTVNDLGSYSVRYTDQNGCVTTSAVLVLTGQGSDNLWVYPNPNFGQFQVRFFNGNPENATVNVYNSNGARVYQKSMVTTLPFTMIDIDLGPTVASGMYLVELVNGSGKRVGAKQILIRRN